MGPSRNEFSNSLCKCLIVLSSRLIVRKGHARKILLPALEEFLPTELAEFAKGKIYREMRVTGGVALPREMRARDRTQK
jgi:hypothetical protein